MKKGIKKICLALSLLIFVIPTKVFAFSASASCSGPSSVTVGDTFSVTISGTASGVTDWKANGPVNSSANIRLGSDTGASLWKDDTASISQTYSFTAISAGTATVSQSFIVTNTDDYSSPTISSNECVINIVEPAPVVPQASINDVNNNSSYTNSNNDTTATNNTNNDVTTSTDATLKSLSIVGYDLKPVFNKDVFEYSVLLKSDTNKIKIDAVANDPSAIISGAGEIEIKEGQNKINIVVALNNGTSKSYVINASKEEKDAIKVIVNNKNYTVSKKLTGMKAPEGYELKVIKIKDVDVESFYNKHLNYYLVTLKDDIGNLTLYVYDMENDKYVKYSPIVSTSFNIIVLPAPESQIPLKYYKSNFKYNDEEVTGYAIDEKSNFRLVYGINTETGKKGFYLYDMEQKTLQRFYDEEVKLYTRFIDKCTIAFYILGGFILFLVIVIIILLSKNVKIKSLYLDKKFGDSISSIDSPVTYQDLEGTTIIDTEEIEEELEPKKKKKKEKKKKEKTFLDE